MKSNNIVVLLISLLGLLVFSACKKEDHEHDHDFKGNVTLKMDHRWSDNMPFSIGGNRSYTLGNGQSISPTEFRYYISNIQLQRTDGSWWIEEESYHIVDASNINPIIELKEVPEGRFVGIKYLIGVDSTRNVSGVQEGALAPSNAMFWSWNTGYIFIKAEGTSPSIVGDNPEYRFHIGGFRSTNSGIRENQFSFGRELIVRRDGSPSIHLNIYPNRFFEGPGMTIDLSTMPRVHMVGENSRKIADNYAQMIEFNHIHN
jgi:hypothetical protein